MPLYKLIFLAVLLSFVSCKEDRERVESDFKIADTGKIQSIEISSDYRAIQKLEKKNNTWWLNDSLRVRPDAIENILRILPNIKVMFYPPRLAWENMLHAIQHEGVHLIIRDAGNRVLKDMRLGGSTNDERGTYAIIEGAKKPFVVQVPGFEGNLATRFIMDNIDWRDRMIIDENPDDIQKIKMTYPAQMSAGFSIEKTDAGYTLEDEHGKKLNSLTPMINTYLTELSKIGCEAIVNEFKYKDTVFLDIPHAVLTLVINNQPERTLKFYSNNLEGEADPERMFVYDGKDFYLAQIRILRKLFRPLGYFQVK